MVIDNDDKIEEISYDDIRKELTDMLKHIKDYETTRYISKKLFCDALRFKILRINERLSKLGRLE